MSISIKFIITMSTITLLLLAANYDQHILDINYSDSQETSHQYLID